MPKTTVHSGYRAQERSSVELHRFAFSTHAYSRQSLPFALKRIADAGFSRVEILADKPHAWLDTFATSDQDRLLKQLKKLDLSVSTINANSTLGFWSDAPAEPLYEPSLISRRRELREWRIAYTKKALRLGKACGAESVTCVSGRALNGVPPEKADKLLLDGLKRLIEYAEKVEQPLAFECAPTLLVEKTDELAEWIAQLDSKYFGASLAVGCAVVNGENPCVAIRKLKGKLFNVRLEDTRDRKNYSRIPGDGDVAFDAIFKALDDVDYAGPLTWNLSTCDEEPEVASAKTFKFCKAAAKK